MFTMKKMCMLSRKFCDEKIDVLRALLMMLPSLCDSLNEARTLKDKDSALDLKPG